MNLVDPSALLCFLTEVPGADRICPATAERLDATVWTADAAWGRGGRVRQVR